MDLPCKQQVKSVCAGNDSSFLLCSSGRLLACGSNQFNKLGFNSHTSGLRKRKAKVNANANAIINANRNLCGY